MIINGDDKINLLNELISNIENQNWSYTFESSGFYSYSEEITRVFDFLSFEDINKIYEDNISKYDYESKKRLDQKSNPSDFSLIDCIIYFNWIWHIEGSGIAGGIINSRINNGNYLLALKKTRDLIKEENNKKYKVEK